VKDEEACRKLRPKPDNHPKPRPKPKPSSADVVAERGVASIGLRSSGNLCVDEEYAQGEAGAQSTTYAYTKSRFSCIKLFVCVCVYYCRT
jgi:hypothetical protein